MAGPSFQFVYPHARYRVDAVEAYARRLADTVNASTTASAELEQRVGPLGWFNIAWDPQCPSPPVVVIHYQPFSWGKWGFAPLLVASLTRLRARQPRPRLAIIVHEVFVTPQNHRQHVMRVWQRTQLRALLGLVDAVLVTKAWSATPMRRLTSKPIEHLGVGSLLPDRREQRSGRRSALGLAEPDIVLATFGTDLVTRDVAQVARCAEALARAGHPTTVLNLGAGAPALRDLPGDIRLFQPGYQDGDELAAWLAAADICVLPLFDGVSSGKTTMMAALAHGLPVIGSAGRETEELLRRQHGDALILVPAEQPELMAAAAVELAGDAARRLAIGASGLRFYGANFGWNVICSRLLDALGRGYPGGG